MFRVHWLIVALAFLGGGWMLFDGTHALLLGDFVTRKNGQNAGELGIWAKVVAAAGIQPRSTPMKFAFVVLGACWVAAGVWFALGYPHARAVLLFASVAVLWFLPFGTLIAAVEILLLFSI